MFEEMLQYVEKLLLTGKRNTTRIDENSFRRRVEHTKRVLMWVNRLLEGDRRVDKEAVQIAAIFHDCGYALFDYKKETHAEASSRVCSNYLERHNFDADRITKIAYLVSNHSKKKKMMHRTDTPKELITLMEADLLDETGSLAILRDCLHEDRMKLQSYLKTCDYIKKHSGRFLDMNPMVTRKGKKYWAEKQKIISLFIKDMQNDLGAM